MKPKTRIDELGRVCTQCDEHKLWECFNRQKSSSTGRRSQCRICQMKTHKKYYTEPEVAEERQRYRESHRGRQNDYNREYVADPVNKRRARSRVLEQKYGISVEEFQQMFSEQDGLCCICETHLVEVRHTELPYACVDHDHETGQVRGILCNSCNFALGGFKDNINTLKRAIEYLEQH